MTQKMGVRGNLQRYIRKYEKANKGTLKCILCDRKVEYQKQGNGKWLELVIAD
jgi:hypothetical protein